MDGSYFCSNILPLDIIPSSQFVPLLQFYTHPSFPPESVLQQIKLSKPRNNQPLVIEPQIYRSRAGRPLPNPLPFLLHKGRSSFMKGTLSAKEAFLIRGKFLPFSYPFRLTVKIRLLKPLHPKVTLWLSFQGFTKRKERKFKLPLCNISVNNLFIRGHYPSAKDSDKSMDRFVFFDAKKKSFFGLEIAFVFRACKLFGERQGFVRYGGDLIVNNEIVNTWESLVDKNMPMVANCLGFCLPEISLVGNMDEGVSSDFLIELC